jgi:hypothetical protein
MKSSSRGIPRFCPDPCENNGKVPGLTRAGSDKFSWEEIQVEIFISRDLFGRGNRRIGKGQAGGTNDCLDRGLGIRRGHAASVLLCFGREGFWSCSRTCPTLRAQPFHRPCPSPACFIRRRRRRWISRRPTRHCERRSASRRRDIAPAVAAASPVARAPDAAVTASGVLPSPSLVSASAPAVRPFAS